MKEAEERLTCDFQESQHSAVITLLQVCMKQNSCETPISKIYASKSSEGNSPTDG